MECICKVIIKSEYGHVHWYRAKTANSCTLFQKCWLNQGMAEWPQLSVLTKTMFYITICGLGVMALVEVIDQLLPTVGMKSASQAGSVIEIWHLLSKKVAECTILYSITSVIIRKFVLINHQTANKSFPRLVIMYDKLHLPCYPFHALD